MDFSGVSGAGEVYEEILLGQVCFEFPVISYIALFVISVMFGYYLLTWSMRYRIDFEYVNFCVCLCALCLVFYFSILLLFVRSVLFPFNCILGWGVVFIFSSFHLIWVSLPTAYMHINWYFRFLGSERSVWGNSS